MTNQSPITNLTPVYTTQLNLDHQEGKHALINLELSIYGEALCNNVCLDTLDESYALLNSKKSFAETLEEINVKAMGLKYILPFLAFVEIPMDEIPTWLQPANVSLSNLKTDLKKPLAELIDQFPIENDWIRQIYSYALNPSTRDELRWVFPRIIQLFSTDLLTFYDAAHCLANNSVHLAVEPMLQRMETKETFVFRNICVALGKLGNEQAVLPLVKKLSTVNKTFQQVIISALGDIGDARVGKILVKVLNDEDENVRQVAVVALGKLGDPNAIDFLKNTLKNDKNAFIRNFANKAIRKLEERN